MLLYCTQIKFHIMPGEQQKISTLIAPDYMNYLFQMSLQANQALG